MNTPFLQYGNKKRRQQVVTFGGLNRGQDYVDGELEDSKGLSAEMYPCMSQRRGRTRVKSVNEGTAIFAYEKLVSVEGGELIYDGKVVGTVTPGEKQIAIVNSKMCIFPDKTYLDITSKEYRSLGEKVELETGTATFTENSITASRLRKTLEKEKKVLGLRQFPPSEVEIKTYKEDKISWSAGGGWRFSESAVETGVDNVKVGDCLMMPKSEVRGIKKPDYYNHGYKEAEDYIDYATDYDKWGDYLYVTEVTANQDIYGVTAEIYAERRNAGSANRKLTETSLKAGDVVTISGCKTKEGNNRTVKIKEVKDMEIIFDSPVFEPCSEAGAVTIERKIPDIDFVCESNNRLWGVSSEKRTIYASALGDPTNFEDYTDGISQNSYAVAVGTDGNFTGIVPYGSNVLCFKEDVLHKVMGSEPSNYAVYTYQMQGIQSGCYDSARIINEVLYYKGRDGVYAYTGGTPQLISKSLLGAEDARAIAGTDGRVYYLSTERAGARELLTYDTRTGLWLKEGDDDARGFATLDGICYMLTGDGIFHLNDKEYDQPNEVEGNLIEWMAQFTPFHEMLHERKCWSRLLLKLELAPGAWVRVEMAQDGGEFKQVWTRRGAFENTWTSRPGQLMAEVIPIRPGRCEQYRVRLSGTGRCVIRSMTREYMTGSVM